MVVVSPGVMRASTLLGVTRMVEATKTAAKKRMGRSKG